MMANLQAFLQSLSKQNIDLVSSSNLLNDLVSENTTDGRFITFFWGVLNDKTKQFESVNMGHNPPLLIRNSEILKLKLGGMLMGVMPSIAPYKNETTLLQKDDILIMFTDGITEAMDEDTDAGAVRDPHHHGDLRCVRRRYRRGGSASGIGTTRYLQGLIRC